MTTPREWTPIGGLLGVAVALGLLVPAAAAAVLPRPDPGPALTWQASLLCPEACAGEGEDEVPTVAMVGGVGPRSRLAGVTWQAFTDIHVGEVARGPAVGSQAVVGRHIRLQWSSVAVSARGETCVAWYEPLIPPDALGTDSVIAVACRPPGGRWSAPVPLGRDFQFDDHTNRQASIPRIGFDGTGRLYLAWAGAVDRVHVTVATREPGGAWSTARVLGPELSMSPVERLVLRTSRLGRGAMVAWWRVTENGPASAIATDRGSGWRVRPAPGLVPGVTTPDLALALSGAFHDSPQAVVLGPRHSVVVRSGPGPLGIAVLVRGSTASTIPLGVRGASAARVSDGPFVTRLGPDSVLMGVSFGQKVRFMALRGRTAHLCRTRVPGPAGGVVRGLARAGDRVVAVLETAGALRMLALDAGALRRACSA